MKRAGLIISLSVFLSISINVRALYTDALRNFKGNYPFRAACELFDSKIRPLDSAEAFREFSNLDGIADELSSRDLKAASLFLKGKYCYDKRIWSGGKPLQYFDQALDLGDFSNEILAEIIFYKGLWYYTKEKNYPVAFEHMLKADNMCSRLGYETMPDGDELLLNLSVAYYHFGDYNKAINYLRIAKNLPSSRKRNKIEIFNNIGLAFRDQDKLDSAVYYFEKARLTAIEQQDQAWIGISNGNLGSIYYKLNRLDEALNYLYRDFKISQEKKQTQSAANAALMISQIYFRQQKFDSSYLMLTEGRNLAYKCNEPRVYILLYRQSVEFYRHTGEVNKALLYTDSLLTLKDKIARTNDLASLERAKNKIETETHLANLKLVESERDKDILVRNGLIGIVLLIFIIVFQQLKRTQVKRKQEQRIYDLEKKRAADQLENANTLLNSYVESLKQKNQLIEQFTQEIEELQSQNGSVGLAEKEDVLKRLQDATILTDKDWLEFKKMFTSVNPSFFIELNEKFPNLTQAEIRQLALSKLGLSIKEKANMLGISPDSVRKTQQRLSKKLNMTEQEIFGLLGKEQEVLS
jgi:hypothetical protein